MGQNNLPPLTMKFQYETIRQEKIFFLFGDLKGKKNFPCLPNLKESYLILSVNQKFEKTLNDIKSSEEKKEELKTLNSKYKFRFAYKHQNKVLEIARKQLNDQKNVIKSEIPHTNYSKLNTIEEKIKELDTHPSVLKFQQLQIWLTTEQFNLTRKKFGQFIDLKGIEFLIQLLEKEEMNSRLTNKNKYKLQINILKFFRKASAISQDSFYSHIQFIPNYHKIIFFNFNPYHVQLNSEIYQMLSAHCWKSEEAVDQVLNALIDYKTQFKYKTRFEPLIYTLISSENIVMVTLTLRFINMFFASILSSQKRNILKNELLENKYQQVCDMIRIKIQDNHYLIENTVYQKVQMKIAQYNKMAENNTKQFIKKLLQKNFFRLSVQNENVQMFEDFSDKKDVYLNQSDKIKFNKYKAEALNQIETFNKIQILDSKVQTKGSFEKSIEDYFNCIKNKCLQDDSFMHMFSIMEKLQNFSKQKWQKLEGYVKRNQDEQIENGQGRLKMLEKERDKLIDQLEREQMFSKEKEKQLKQIIQEKNQMEKYIDKFNKQNKQKKEEMTKKQKLLIQQKSQLAQELQQLKLTNSQLLQQIQKISQNGYSHIQTPNQKITLPPPPSKIPSPPEGLTVTSNIPPPPPPPPGLILTIAPPSGKLNFTKNKTPPPTELIFTTKTPFSPPPKTGLIQNMSPPPPPPFALPNQGLSEGITKMAPPPPPPGGLLSSVAPSVSQIKYKSNNVPPPPTNLKLTNEDFSNYKTDQNLINVSVKQKCKPKLNLRGCMWTSIPYSKIEFTIWKQMDDNKILKKMNLLEIEKQFFKEEIKEKKLTILDSKKEKISLLASERSKNIQLILGKLRLANSIISQSLYTCDQKHLSLSNLESLCAACPTQAEVQICLAYTGNQQDLGNAEKYVREIGKIPKYYQRLHGMRFAKVYKQLTSDIEIKLKQVRIGFQSFRDHKQFHKILEIVLAMGNYLNGDSIRGGAWGIKLDSIDRMADVKSVDGKKNAFIYLVEFAWEQLGKPLIQRSEIQKYEECSKFPITQFNSELNEIKKGFKFLKNAVASKQISVVHDHIQKVYGSVIPTMQKEISNFTFKINQLEELFKGVCRFYCQDPKQSSQIFGSKIIKLLNFIIKMEGMTEKYIQKRQQEQKKVSKSLFPKQKQQQPLLNKSIIPSKTVEQKPPKQEQKSNNLLNLKAQSKAIRFIDQLKKKRQSKIEIIRQSRMFNQLKGHSQKNEKLNIPFLKQ